MVRRKGQFELAIASFCLPQRIPREKELITGSNVLFGLDAADPASETDLSYPNTLYPKEIRGLSKDVHLY